MIKGCLNLAKRHRQRWQIGPDDFDIGGAPLGGGQAVTLGLAGNLEEAVNFGQQCLDHRLEN